MKYLWCLKKIGVFIRIPNETHVPPAYAIPKHFPLDQLLPKLSHACLPPGSSAAGCRALRYQHKRRDPRYFAAIPIPELTCIPQASLSTRLELCAFSLGTPCSPQSLVSSSISHRHCSYCSRESVSKQPWTPPE